MTCVPESSPGNKFVSFHDRPDSQFFSIEVKGRLDHAISREPIPGWKGTNDVETAVDVDMGDYVVYDDWVGQVIS